MPEIDRLDSTDGTDGTDVTMVLERGARLLTIQRLPYDGRKRRS